MKFDQVFELRYMGWAVERYIGGYEFRRKDASINEYAYLPDSFMWERRDPLTGWWVEAKSYEVPVVLLEYVKKQRK